MRCNYCNKETYITHICPYCKEYYCLEHRKPDTHNCSAYQQVQPLFQKPPPQKIQISPDTTKKLQKNFFAFAFTLVLIEEILRIISYLRYSPFLEPNIYVVFLSQWITPYIASPIFFLATCFTLFLTKKLSERLQPKTEFAALLRKVVPFGIYATITIIYAYSIANWILILQP